VPQRFSGVPEKIAIFARHTVFSLCR